MAPQSLNFFSAVAIFFVAFIAFNYFNVEISKISRAKRAAEKIDYKSCTTAGSISFTFDGEPDVPGIEHHIALLANTNSNVAFFVAVDSKTNETSKNWYKTLVVSNHLLGMYWKEYEPKSKKWEDFDASLKESSAKFYEITHLYPRFVRIPEAYASHEVFERVTQNGLVPVSYNVDMTGSDCMPLLDPTQVNKQYDTHFATFNNAGLNKKPSFIARHPINCWNFPSYTYGLQFSVTQFGYNVVPLATCLGVSDAKYNTVSPTFSPQTANPNHSVNSIKLEYIAYAAVLTILSFFIILL